ncbi:MAG: 6-phospho-3-hexuloisomerase [Promethearchaeota archaeon]|nr:MAG: 6-phospho-3-hexuloisomerase [Candidatus Lokiarchaeota archaeon]
MNNVKKQFIETLQEIADYIISNSEKIDSTSIITLIEKIIEINNKGNRVFIYGAGRSGFMGRAFAQRLMHLGINSCFVSDAVTYRYTANDLALVISGSGETTSSVAIAQKAYKIGGFIALLTGTPKSTIGALSNLIITIEGKSKDKATSQKTLAPYTSLFDICTLSVLDSIGGVLMTYLKVTEEDIDNRHASIE